MTFNGFVLAGTHSGAGKTTITAGVLAALKKRGLAVQPFKTGPDYIDPAFHNFVTEVPSRNLDTWLMEASTVTHLFAKSCQMAEVTVVEGVMGLFDGFGGTEDIGSTAFLAKVLRLPVVLIIDGSAIARSAAAIVHGFATFDKDLQIAGVIVNRVGSGHHYDLIREAIESATGIPCLGYMLKNQEIKLTSRHLGLIPASEVEDLKDKLAQVAEMVEETIDLDRLLALTQCEKPVETSHSVSERFNGYQGLRVGIAKDQSFNFYYEDNIELMEKLGCECVYFSPMHDEALPENCDFIYIGGGFPEVFAQKLSENHAFINDLRRYHESGRPLYAECGGLMYLTQAITDFEGNRYETAGLLPGETRMTGKLKHFGYNEVVTRAEFTGSPIAFKAHEFHRSEYINHELTPGYDLYKFKGEIKEKHWNCGYSNGLTFGAYAHVHFYSEPQWLYFWLDQAKLKKETSYEGI